MRASWLALCSALVLAVAPAAAHAEDVDLGFVRASGPGLRAEPAGDGITRLTADGAVRFDVREGERLVGFGERSNAVDQRGREVDDYVADGPYRPEDRNFTKASVPPWAQRDRDDATYFPIPWLLSSRGYGVLVDNDETSTFDLRGADGWTVGAEAPQLRLRVFAGPRPADALRRFTAAVGRQPPPPAPWAFGPWFQTGQPNVVALEDEARIIKTFRDADAPVSAAETQMHYLPCGAQRGNEAYLKARNAQFHAAGLAHLAYFNPSVCQSYSEVYDAASAQGLLQKAGGTTFAYPSFVGGSGPAGFTQEPIAQFDFTHPGTEPFYEGLVRRAIVDDGHDGFMEDFGENTPPFAESADGTPGAAMHNRYPVTYHCTVRRIAQRLGKPVVRFQRSGWTGAAACADAVWGGDPTTVWGFDGLASALTQGLTMGLSGVSRWGTDIGGYNSFGPAEQLDAELLQRWIELGSVTGVMRTKRSGIAVPSYARPQVFDPEILPVWRRYTKLRTQLYPYLLAADAEYRRTGRPLMRHLLLAFPGDPQAGTRDDELMFGPSLLAAPVVTPAARERELYLPPGRWVDWWRTIRYGADGSFTPGHARILRGRRVARLPAPLAQLPLLVRAGAVLPLLPADVDTLSGYGEAPGLVHLAERAGRLTLLAFPRGRSRAGLYEDERVTSTEGRRRWTLRVHASTRRTYTVRASLATLRHPFVPRRVTGARSWRYDRATRVLTARLRGATLRVYAASDRTASRSTSGGAPLRR